MSLTFPRTRRRSVGLTPMIDVVFLLLVFFLLAARFSQESMLSLGSAGAGSTGDVPRLVDIGKNDLRLNGIAVAEGDLLGQLRTLTSEGDQLIVIRPAEGVALQRMIDVIDQLAAGGLTTLAVVE